MGMAVRKSWTPLVLSAVAATSVWSGPAVARPPLRQMIVDESFRAAPTRSPVKGFRAHGGDWRVKDGVVSVGAGPGPKLVYGGPAFAVGEVGVEVRLPGRGDGNAGLIVKVGRAGTGADRFDGYEVSLDARGQFLRLGRHRQNYEPIRDTPCPVPVDAWVPLVVRVTETTLEVVVSGRTVLRYEDKQHPLRKGTVGLRPWQRPARFRNLWIKAGAEKQRIPFEAAAPGGEQSVSPPWRALVRGSARAAFGVSSRRDQRIAFVSGRGEAGIEHRGEDGAGIAWAAGRPYRGFVIAQCDKATALWVAAEGTEGETLAEMRLDATPGRLRRLGFALVPSKDDRAGRLAVKLKGPGSVRLSRVVLEPGDWAWPGTLAVEALPPIAFIARHPLTAPPAVGQDLWAAQPRAPGCSICVTDPTRPERAPRTVFADPDGCIYDMNVSPDAQTLLFSYRRKGQRHWHIWRIGADGSGLRQLTDGPHYDVSPCVVPGGDIVFVSTRRFGYTVCQPGPASNLHRMAPDGRSVRCVSMNTLSDFSPQMLPDGRVLFTRWEYIDRDLTYRQSLWTQNPDGSGYRLYFGNTIRDVGTFWQARPLPGRADSVVATFAPHHGFPHGAIGLIKQQRGLEAAKNDGFTYITQEFPTIRDSRHEWAYRDPCPLTARSFLCSYGGAGLGRYRLFVLDAEDRKRLLYEHPEMGCYFPLPLRRSPEPPTVAPRASSRAADPQPMATFLLLDVYQGLEPAIARGRVRALRIMEQVRKTADLASRAYDQSPVMSYATYYAKRTWGTVPVEADGSAHFRAPALREIYFQALDAEGRELQRMTSGVQAMAGERVSCIGCHEPRQQAPPASGRAPLAALRPPSVPLRPAWALDGIIDFPTVVQPVLDKHCVRCHNGSDAKSGYDLTGDKTRLFSMAYDHLLGRSRSYRQHDMATGEMLPKEKARGKPLVHFYWLLRTPTAINQPLWTGCHASRLTQLIESDHAERPIPLEDRQRIYIWIDANVPYYGTYAHSRPLSPGKRDLCTDAATGKPSEWFARDFLAIYKRRCQSCHGGVPHSNDHRTIWDGRLAWINFTRPKLSSALTAHLRKEDGGRGIAKARDGKPIPLLSTADPDYQALLRAIERGSALAAQRPRADMPGFQGARKEP